MGSLRLTGAEAQDRLKTIDVGNRGTTVSVDNKGTILGLTTFHPKHGIVVAEPYQQFPGDRFHDSDYVRRYRTRMLELLASDLSPGYGICVERGGAPETAVEYESMNAACITRSFEDGLRVITTFVVTEDQVLVQRCKLVNTSATAISVPWSFVANISVNRASYGQLTEGGPIPLPNSENQIKVLDDGTTAAVINNNLGAHIVCTVEVDGERLPLTARIQPKVFHGEPAQTCIEQDVEIAAQSSTVLAARFQLRPGITPESLSDPVLSALEASKKFWRGSETRAQYILRRNLDYILGCCSVSIPASEEVVCIITDHVALPLGWNRDNYWQVRFLMDAWQHLGSISACQDAVNYASRIERVLRGHLNWVWRYARRPHGYWHRSYLTTGKPKDGPVFQLDQQCYPLLELADFFQHFPEQVDFVRALLDQPVVDDVVKVIASKVDKSSGLVATEETPGDDPVEFEFHFSSHVLLWYTLRRLSTMLNHTDVQKPLLKAQIDHLAVAVRKATMAHFLKPHPVTGEPVFAYLTDGSIPGESRMYHDANDIPTLFAKEWGLVESPAEIAAWQNTLRFAHTAANEGCFSEDSRYGGLGSIHSPAPWPLGFYQTWIFSQMIEDRRQEAEAWAKICGVMQIDGTFCEAIDATTGNCMSKAWFSWPGSMIGSGLLREGNRTKYLASG